jgi:8-amino-7-oxononanoate synthase|tara:strand:+ start:901 stop:1086 length:186 start_codon:yes stop_codon:yes gene_type:complete
MDKFSKKLSDKLSQRLENNALRSLPHTKALIDFSSNDYLGMARNGELEQNTLELLKKYIKA